MHSVVRNDVLAKGPKKSIIIPTVIMILFALFSWGFLYNLFIRIGFTEFNSQALGLSLAIIVVLIVEAVTRKRLSLMIKYNEATGV